MRGDKVLTTTANLGGGILIEIVTDTGRCYVVSMGGSPMDVVESVCRYFDAKTGAQLPGVETFDALSEAQVELLHSAYEHHEDAVEAMLDAKQRGVVH